MESELVEAIGLYKEQLHSVNTVLQAEPSNEEAKQVRSGRA
jgi:hypothetical protein